MKIPPLLSGLRLPARALALLGASLATLALAETARAGGPEGGAVAKGTARIAATAGRTTIRQTSKRAVIDWKGFDVSRDHEVVFAQPGRSAATLNRVQSVKPSIIAGAVKAPGTVIIQNAAGVLFTGSARIDTGSLVATSKGVDAARFQRDGGISLGGGERAGARVVNEGRITVGEAGLAALVGGDVENAGAIVARRGTVVLSAGSRTAIDFTGDGMVRIAVEGDSGRVTNRGSIDADGGRVVLSAGDAARTLNSAINTSGVIRAGSGGRIEIAGGGGKVRISGTLDASGPSRGGEITVTGQRVTVATGARVTADGGTDGGRIRLGGDRQGRGPLPRARTLDLEAGAVVSASGSRGRGGSIVAWSETGTRVDGSISATGPAAGGFIETSSRGALALGPTASVSAGVGGFWLLDPRDVIIDNVSNAPAIGGGTLTPPAGGTAYTVSLIALQNALNAGSNVTVTTVQPAAHMQGDITVKSQLGWSGPGGLTLLAERDIAINAAVSAGGDFTAIAGRNLNVGADVTATGDASVALTAQAGDLTTKRSQAGNLAITTESGTLALTAGHDVIIHRANTQRGGIQVDSATGDLTITAGHKIWLRGGDKDDQWVRVGTEGSASTTTLRAPQVKAWGGAGDTSFAELVTGAGGAISVLADLVWVKDHAQGSEARIAARDGGSLTLDATTQTWAGVVQSGRDLSDGGDVRLSGAITATVRPLFSLAPGADFVFAPATPGGAPSSYSSSLPFAVSTTGTGSITLGAPVTASQVTLVSQEQVRLAAGARVTGTAAGDAVVIAAGRSFDNAAGPGALVTPHAGARWLVYVDSFASPTGTLPGSREYDLYGRTFTANPPGVLGFAGNRIVYAERPTLTLTAETLHKTYGQTAAPGYTASGLRIGDSLATALASGPNVTSSGTADRASARSYLTRVAATASAQGYLLVLANGTLIVDPATLTVTALDSTRTYGADNPAFSSSIDGFLPGDGTELMSGTLTYSTSATRSSPVGRYTVTPGGLIVPSGNYAISFRPGTLAIDPASLTVTALDAARSYGGSDPDFNVRYAGFVLGEDAGDLGGALGFSTTATRSSPVGRYSVTPGGLTSGNYAISFRPGTLAIDPASLTVTALDAARSYGGSDPDFNVRYAGFVLGEDAGDLGGALGFSTTATRSSPVGRYSVTPGGLTSGNYAISFRPGTLAIDPASLTVTALDAARSYGGSDPDFNVRYTGFVLGEDAGDLGGALGFSTTATRSSPVGRYSVTPGGLTSGNYAISFRPGTLAIDPASLTVTALDAARSYGGSDPDFNVRYAGFVLGEDAGDLRGALGFSTTATRSSPVGRYSVTPGGLTSGNYAISFRPGTLAIDPASLTVTALDAARSYGGSDPDFNVRYTGFVLGEDAGDLRGALGFSTTATRSSPVGRYGVTPGGLTSGNYAISFRPGTLAIDPASLTVTALDAARSYGGSDPDFNVRYAGFVLGEDAGDLRGALGFSTTATRSSPVGRYSVTPGGLTSGNYAISFRPGTLAIDPESLTVTALDAARSYGGSDPDFNVRYAGFVLGEDAGDLGGALGFSTTATRSSPVGRYSVTPGGLTSGNYAISFRPGTLAIDPASLTVTALDAARSYGGSDPDFNVRYAGFVLGEDAGDLGGALGFSTTATRSSPVGRYSVTPGGLTSGNYAISFVSGRYTVRPAEAGPSTPAPTLAENFGALPFGRGVPPLTPGDASFRTTVTEAPPALANPFDLTYSLGEIVQLAPAGGAGTQGFTPAAGGADTQGFVPASGGAGARAEQEERRYTGCSGAVGRGGDDGCERQTVTETYWNTSATGAP